MAPRRKSLQTSTLPASLILTSREEKYFRRYQRTNATVPADRQGLLPTAAEYLAFQCWYKQRDSGYFSDTSLGTLATYLERKKEESNAAKLCKHPLHPSHGAEHTSCPPCIVELYMRYVDLLKENLTNGNGAVQQRWGPSNDDPVVMAWRTGKVHLLRAVATIEKWAASESDWEERHADVRIDNTKTAKQALQMYHAAVDSAYAISTQSVGSDFSFVSYTSSTSSVGSPDAKSRRSVSFVEDTSFSLGRPPQYFCRKSARYEAGKYAVAVESDSEDEDESMDEEEESKDEEDGNQADSEEDEDDEDEEELNTAIANLIVGTTGHVGEKNALQQQVASIAKVAAGDMNNNVKDIVFPEKSTDKDGEQDSSSDESDSEAGPDSEPDSSSDEGDSDEDGEDEGDDDDDDAEDADPGLVEEASFIVFE